MNLTLVVALLIPTQAAEKPPQRSKTKIVGNAQSLVETDWSDDARVLSLRPGKRIETGEAWLFDFDGHRPRAWQGVYEFSRTVEKSEKVANLKIAFTRDYTLKPFDDRQEWLTNYVFEPKGMVLDIPLDDDAIPTETVEFSVRRGFPADKKGRDIGKPPSPTSYFDRIVSGEKPMELPFAKIGDTYRLRPMTEDFLAARKIDAVPLSFERRKAKTPDETDAADRGTKKRSPAPKQTR